jgi:hypothetical protein
VVRRTAIPAALAALALFASVACSSGGADRGSAGANPTLATDPPRTNPTLATVPAPTTTTNPYAVPAVIDAVYVNRVLAELDAVMGDVTRMVIRTKTITVDAYDRMKAVYQSTEFLQLAVDGFESDMREGFSSYKPSPGNTISSVTRILAATPKCIFAEVRRDYSGVALAQSAVSQQWIGLIPLDRSRDPKGFNKTSWAFVYDGVPRDRSQPNSPCVA